MNNNDRQLKDIMEELFRAFGWTEKMDGVKIVNCWDKVVGGIIAKHTTKIFVNSKKLYVSVDSAALSHELYMQRSELVKKLNKAAGKEIIKDLIIK
jgi:predicted nucleic acid-binding Zn ribbon protein